MKIYNVVHIESGVTINAIPCLTKKIAERIIVKVRDALIVKWQEQVKVKYNKLSSHIRVYYKNKIASLSDENYACWRSAPFDKLQIDEIEVIDK